MTDGILLMKLSQGSNGALAGEVAVAGVPFERAEMLDRAPTKATGIAQNMMSAVTKAVVAIFLIILDAQLILRLFQMTSSGLMPIKRGDMCRG